MAGLPKIAIARLKANPAAPKSSGVPSGLGTFQGGQHPDANLLSAFVEKTLTEQERTQVLNHLSQCADCRKVAAFIQPPEALIPEPAREAAGRHWSPWLVLRWGALAAVLGALTIVALLHPGSWNRHPEVAKVTPPPVPAGKVTSAPQTASPPPFALPPPEAARAGMPGEAHESAGEVVAVGKAAGPQESPTLDNHARAKANQQVTMLPSTRPPATFRAENGLAVKAEQEESRGGNALSVVVSPQPPPPSAPAAAPAAESQELAKSSAELQAGPATLHAATQSVAVYPSAQPLQPTTPDTSTTGGLAGPPPVVATVAKAAPRVTAQAGRSMAARTSLGAATASAKDLKSKASPPAALWSVSADGIVQRSTDGGKTFAPIPVAGSIKFLAIAALDNEVWAGGPGGALYHSSNGGGTWNWVGIIIEGNAVTESVNGIQLRDPQHLTVTTASGSQWVSENGGRTWQKNP
jgi:hypothetical protein